MRYTWSLLLGALLLGGACSEGSGSGFAVESVSTVSPTTSGYCLGVSAPYSGASDGVVLVSGGANFPDVPASDGGTKVYYDQIFALQGDGSWVEAGRLDSPRAYGSTVSLGDWLYFIGGADALGSISDVVAYSYLGGELSSRDVADLPLSLEQGGAAVVDSVIYWVGGLSSGAANLSIYSLDLRGSDSWERLSCELPVGMVQPLVVSSGESLYIWGGFTPASDSCAARTVDYGYRFTPSTGQWERIESFVKDGVTQSMVGASGVAYSGDSIIVTGGVDRVIFDSALERSYQIANNKTCELNKLKELQRQYMLQEPDYYKFNSQVMLYNTKTQRWKELLREPRTARAGAALVLQDNELYILGGETKPGIRTPQNTKIKL